jgi:hypothetical protein
MVPRSGLRGPSMHSIVGVFPAPLGPIKPNHLELVDNAGPYRLRGEFRAINRYVVLGVGCEPPDGVGIELPLNPRPCAAWLG